MLIVLVACTSVPDGGAGASSDGPTGNPGDGTTSAPAGEGDQSWRQAYGPPDPVDVSVSFSDVALTSRVSTANGGFLSLVGPDGTFFQFEVPPNAVLSDLDITMTLVSSIDGSPLGDELVGAVAFEPEGLTFMQPATLTIMPATPIGIAEEGPFSTAGDGSDFHLYPLDVDPSVVRMHVHHFSLFGLFKTDAERRAEMIRKTARDVEAQLTQLLQKELSLERERQILGATDDDQPSPAHKAAEDAYQTYRDRVLRPMMLMAERDHNLYFEATQRYLAWERGRQLLGVTEDDAWDAEMYASWMRAYENYFRYTVQRCYEHDLGAIIDLMKAERAHQLLGVDTAGGPGEAWDLAEKCSTFTLEMESSTEMNLTTCGIGAGTIKESARVTAEVEIRPWDDGPWSGPMKWEAATHSASCQILSSDVAACTSSFGGFADASQFTVHGVDFELNMYGPRAKDRPENETQARLNVFRMVVQPGAPQIIYDSACEGGWVVFGGSGSDSDADDGPWYRAWRSLTNRMPCRGHVNLAPEEDSLSTAYYLDCWQYVGRGEELARWEYEATDNTLGRTAEQTTFVLKHTPRQ